MMGERKSKTLNEGSFWPRCWSRPRSEATRLAPAAAAFAPPGFADPEVAAKPKRRQFTAAYRLRILEEAERLPESPGEHRAASCGGKGCTARTCRSWRKARREGSAGMRLSFAEAWSEAEAAQSAGAQGACSSRRRLPGSKSELREGAHDPGRPGKSCRAAGIQPRGAGRTR